MFFVIRAQSASLEILQKDFCRKLIERETKVNSTHIEISRCRTLTQDQNSLYCNLRLLYKLSSCFYKLNHVGIANITEIIKKKTSGQYYLVSTVMSFL